MNILLAPDSFKGTFSSWQVARAFATAVEWAYPSARYRLLPLADGGEGSTEAVTTSLGGERIPVDTEDALGRPIRSSYGWVADSKTAIVSVADASGLAQLAPHDRNVLRCSTYGTGVTLRRALDRGARSILLALGGSATNDLGLGILSALGVQFFAGRQPVHQPTAADLKRIDAADTTSLHALARPVSWTLLCDVEHPLLGNQGAMRTFLPQKGIATAEIPQLQEQALNCIRALPQLHEQMAFASFSGAAGGIALGLQGFLNVRVEAGADYILDQYGIATHLRWADLVLTGEGRLDEQTKGGKLIQRLARRSQHSGVPVIAICGQLALDHRQIEACGLRAAFALQAAQQITAVEEVHDQQFLVQLAWNILRCLALH